MQEEPKIALIAEDELTTQRLLVAVFESLGFTCVTCVNGQQCLDYLAQGHRPDLLMLDLHMPEVSGLDVLVEIKKHFSDCNFPIVVATATDHHETFIQVTKLGAHDWIIKPFPILSFKQRIIGLLQKFPTMQDEHSHHPTALSS